MALTESSKMEGTTALPMSDGSVEYFINSETAVPAYQLPDLLGFASDPASVMPADWQKHRLALLDLFSRQVYGQTPDQAFQLSAKVTEEWTAALGGLGCRKQVTLVITTEMGERSLPVLLYAPAASDKAFSCFAGLNFSGNHGIHPDEQIHLNQTNLEVASIPRGQAASRYPINTILQSGFALATLCYHDAAPDAPQKFRQGIHALFDDRKDQDAGEGWGCLSAWAFCLSRVMDYLETEPRIDARKVAVFGHSRLGKAALWAAAQDERFAMAISNNSGCGGAALSRRAFGETVSVINRSFPHWFCENFKQYADNEAALPVDQHQLLALIAPRPLYVASAENDWWADPRGEFLASKAASAAYQALGHRGLPMTEFPPLHAVDHSGRVAYHIRAGDHDLTAWDWQQYLAFARKKFFENPG